MLFLMAARAISIDCEWAKMYQQLLPRMCSYDERIKDYRGKMKVLGRIAGQMASMIFVFQMEGRQSPPRTIPWKGQRQVVAAGRGGHLAPSSRPPCRW